MAGTHEEQAWRDAGYSVIAGVDEVGRGCWAGPVVAAAVILPAHVLDQPDHWASIDDSKALRPAVRNEVAHSIRSVALAIGVGSVPAHLIDLFGIGRATQWAMMQAVLALPVLPQALIIDWVHLPELPLPQRCIPRADAISISVAAASIIAKVQRDHLMTVWGQHDPRYHWETHKGYGTVAHRAALHRHGPSPLHRRSFRPVQECLTELLQLSATD